MSALNTQIAGEHYKKFVIQPIEFITINNLPFIEGNVIKYICRWKEKGGVDDLDKAIHYIELLKELKHKMQLTLEELKERLADRLDEITLLELLNITSYDLVERFSDLVEDNYDKLQKEINDDYEPDELQ